MSINHTRTCQHHLHFSLPFLIVIYKYPSHITDQFQSVIPIRSIHEPLITNNNLFASKGLPMSFFRYLYFQFLCILQLQHCIVFLTGNSIRYYFPSTPVPIQCWFLILTSTIPCSITVVFHYIIAAWYRFYLLYLSILGLHTRWGYKRRKFGGVGGVSMPI